MRTPRRAEANGHPPTRNTAYVIQLEDLTICHLGDLTETTLTNEQLNHIKDSAVLLVPVGGHCTINAAQAAEVVAQVEPKIIVPMHYATDETRGHLELDDISRFCREMGSSDASPRPRLTVTAASLPSEPTVVLLEPRR